MNHIAILGRQPALGLAELERVFGAENAVPISGSFAGVTCTSFDVQQFGGIIKAGKILDTIDTADWKLIHNKVHRRYSAKWQSQTHKQTFAISVYGVEIAPKKIAALELSIKSELKKFGVSARTIPHPEAIISSAISHHNKLGLSDNKTEIMLLVANGSTIIAESVGAQNITALAARDQGRPKTDAFVGMLPPKLALQMINLAHPKPGARILDPFCGTGVVLQEALLLGYGAHGTDLSEKMVEYSTENIAWLTQKFHINVNTIIRHGDAIETQWQAPVDAVICETYLGQPFSAPPASDKLQKVMTITNEIITKFLQNLAPQILSGTPLCLAIPAWNDGRDNFAFLPVKKNIEALGYKKIELTNVKDNQLLYYRDGQVVARDILLLERA